MALALLDDPLRRGRPDAGHSQQVGLAGLVDVERELVDVRQRDDGLGVVLQREESRRIVSVAYFVVLVPVDALEPVDLVEAVRPPYRRRLVVLQRRVADRQERIVVDPLEVPLPVELRHPLVDVPVRLVRRADYELGHLSYRAARIALSQESVHPVHLREHVAFEVLHLAEPPHALDRRRFEVHGQAGPQPVGLLDVLVLGARHDLEVNVPLEVVLVADEIDDLDELLRRLRAGTRHAGTEEQPRDGVPLLHLVEGAGKLVDLEREPLAGHPVAVRAEVAVHLAEVGEHHAEQVDGLAVRHRRLVDARRGIPLGPRVGRAHGSVVMARSRTRQNVVRSHSRQLLQLLVPIRVALYQHGCSPPTPSM